MNQYIPKLEAYQKYCEKQRKFQEADTIRERISLLKGNVDKMKMENLKTKQINERLLVEEAYLKEFVQFIDYWDRKIELFSEKALEIQADIKEKHGHEMEFFNEENEKTIRAKLKESPELLNLKRILDTMVKQQNYKEAHSLQQQVDKLEKEEKERWEHNQEQKFIKQRNLLEQRQNNELQALNKKIKIGEMELGKIRAIELERLLQKYQNVKKGVENAQMTEIQRTEKGTTLNKQKLEGQSKLNVTPGRNRAKSRKENVASIMD